jgi:hypothetical protein
MPIPGFLKNIFAGGAGELVKSIGDAADKIFTSKEEKAAFLQAAASEINRNMEKMQELATQETEALLKDNDSARNRETQIATSEHAPLLNKVVTPILALGIIILTFTLFYMVMFKALGAEKDIVIYILGVLSAVVTQIISYYFGSSQGSANKQKQLESMMK